MTVPTHHSPSSMKARTDGAISLLKELKPERYTYLIITFGAALLFLCTIIYSFAYNRLTTPALYSLFGQSTVIGVCAARILSVLKQIVQAVYK